MADKILVFYGSYRSDRLGIRLANYVVAGLQARGCGRADRRQGDRPADAGSHVQGIPERGSAGGFGRVGAEDPQRRRVRVHHRGDRSRVSRT
jgi:hypothetical protein